MRPAWLLLVVACSTTEPATAVVVVVDAEYGVAQAAERVQIRVLGGATEAELQPVLEQTLGGAESITWPVLVTVAPEGNDAMRTFRIEAVATDASGAEVGAARALTRFAPDRVVSLRLLLEDCCRAVSGTCSATQTCRACQCESYSVDADGLPTYTGRPSSASTMMDASVVPDGGPSDSGSDVGLADTGAQDTGPIDTGPPDTGPPCMMIQVETPATQDGDIPRDQCNGSIVWSAGPLNNIGGNDSWRGLFKFNLSPEVVAAWQGGRARSMQLRIHPAGNRTACSGSCTSLNAAGAVVANPLRNDWVEGTLGVDRSGADWCRTRPSGSWGMPGAGSAGTDIGEVSGRATWPGSTDSSPRTIELDPSIHLSWLGNAGETNMLSVRVVADTGSAARLVFSTREFGNASEPPATLIVTYCQ